MSPPLSEKPSHLKRKRRAHVKSRFGCGNCKIRQIKCDETRPRCAQCEKYRVCCEYGVGKDALKLSAHGQGSFQVVDFQSGVVRGGAGTTTSAMIEGSGIRSRPLKGDGHGVLATGSCPPASKPPHRTSIPRSPVSMNCILATTINTSLHHSSQSIPFTPAHLAIFSRFHTRTGHTIGDTTTASAYLHNSTQLALSHPFLMHMLLSLTLMHDADLLLPTSPLHAAAQKHSALQHWHLATALFNTLLTYRISPSSRDAIWTMGVHIGAASFWYTESVDDVEKVWPLKGREVGDFAWMKIGEGKRLLWRVAEPMREDGLFREVVRYRVEYQQPDIDIERVPERVRRALGIASRSSAQTNVYYTAVLAIAGVQKKGLTYNNLVDFLHVSGSFSAELQQQLEVKDPRAVFVLGWWFQTFEDGEVWWMVRRAKVEGEAVRIWLGRYHGWWAGLLDSLAAKTGDEGWD